MGVEYTLVNATKRERVSFSHMGGSKKREIAGNPAQAALVTWYVLSNQGDSIQFVSDAGDDWPFNSGKKSDLRGYTDVTMTYVGFLIEQGILANRGCSYVDEDDPDNVYILDLRNVWSNNS